MNHVALKKSEAALKNQKEKKHKIGCYIRVSTEEQAENPEGSIKNQEDRLRVAVQLKNMEGNFGEIADVFIDRARSGKDTNRPELQRLLNAIQKHEISLVMVSELSRLSRSMRDFSQIWELMQQNNCDLYSLRESFDTTTAAGEMVLFTIANIAQFERRQVVERVKANMNARAARGLYNGGVVPLGFRLIPNKPGYLDVDREHAETVKKAFQAFVEQGSLSAAARWLNEKGFCLIRERQGGGNKTRMGHFTIHNLEDILKNKAYLGVRTYQERGETVTVKAVWEPIIDVDLFNRVQTQLSSNRSTYKPDTFKKFPYELSGLVYCSQCGSSLCGKSAHGSRGKIPYYEHAWLTKRDGCLVKKAFSCRPFRIRADVLEPLVWEKIELLLSNQEIVEELIRDAQKRFTSDNGQADIDRAKKRLKGLGSQLEVLGERLATLPRSISPSVIYSQIERIEAAKKEEQERLKSLENHNGPMTFPVELSTYEKFLVALKDLRRKDRGFDRGKMARALVHRIEIMPDSYRLFYKTGNEEILGELAEAGSLSRSLDLDTQDRRGPEPLLGGSDVKKNFFLFNRSRTLTNGVTDGA